MLHLLLACAEPAVPAFVDADCDGIEASVDCDDHDDDLGLPPTWYADADGDGYGDLAAPVEACARPDGAAASATDCDDADPSTSPGAPEACGGRDEDCDGLRDDEDDDVTGTSTWYADDDGDGVGGEELGRACEADGVPVGGDCDDGDATRATDCDDTCAHPDVEALAAVALMGVSDVMVDDDCFAYLSTVLTYDYVQLVHPSGLELTRFATWGSVTDLPAMALDPDDGDVWVLGVTTNGNAPMVGRVSGNTVEKVADGIYTTGTSWIGVYMNRNAQSLASDGACVWAPNFAGNGTVVCVREDGTQSTLATLPARVESVAISPAGTLHAAAGATIYALDGAGSATEAWTFDATVLDFAFAGDGSVYVETTGDVVIHADGAGQQTFASVQYDGKLVLTPDGWLVRLMPYWNGGTGDIASLWEEWPL